MKSNRIAVAAGKISIVGVTAAVALIVSAGAAQAGTFICVPPQAGAAVVSGGPDGTCDSVSTAVQLPSAAADQQRLISMLPYVLFNSSGVGGKPTITFTGANVQVAKRADTAATTADGTGNLVVGRANNPYNRARSGSENLIVGDAHGWTGQNALLGGFDNQSRGFYNVAFGQDGLVSGDSASVLGGYGNTASGLRSSVAGGANKTAAGVNELIADGVGAGGFTTVGRGEGCSGTCSSEYYNTYLEAWAGCPWGMTLVGGGFDVVPGRYSNGTRYPVSVQRNAPYPGYDYWVVGVNVQQLSFLDLKAYAVCVKR